MKKVAIIGSGIGGTSAAYYLSKKGYDISVFEAGDYFGGHTHTHEITVDCETFSVDSGFLVHNDRTYPHLIKFFRELGVSPHKSDMTFSVCRLTDDVEWGGTNLITLFAQVKNLIRPSFHRMIKDLLRFNKNSEQYLVEAEADLEMTLGDLLKKYQYGEEFQKWYLLPMGGCIWSSPMSSMLNFPAHTFLRFCINHGLLQIFDRPQWKSIKGGCNTYTKKALLDIEKKYLNERVLEVRPENGKVNVITSRKQVVFDYVVLAAHPPQILNFLKTDDNELITNFNKIKYQPNTAILHTDTNILPKRKSIWSAWNYSSLKDKDSNDQVSVSYLLNTLQDIPIKKPIIVTLNPVEKIDKKQILKTMEYEHPLLDKGAVSAQNFFSKNQGRHGLFFSGAWMRYGFHEDGIWATHQILEIL